MDNYFDPHDFILATRGDLPHWTQFRKIVFVTFRLADSVPLSVIRQYEEEHTAWRKEHPYPSNKELEEWHSRRMRALERYADSGCGSCLLQSPHCRSIVCDSLLFRDGRQYTIHSFVVMPNHVHLLMELYDSHTLQSTVTALKRYTATAINRLLNRNGRLWQDEYFDRIIRNEKHYDYTMGYIRDNPRNCPPGTFGYYKRGMNGIFSGL